MKKKQLSLRENGLIVLVSLGVTGVIAVLFYHSAWGMILSPGVCVLTRKIWIEKKEESEKRHMREHFMRGLQILNGSLQAGFSMENAWKEVERETLLLSKQESVFYQEICQMNRSVTFNMPIEKLFLQVASRAEIEEMISFAQIMEFGKKNGGNWKHIMEDAIFRMLERYEAKKEIDVMIAGKRMEQQVMNVIPLGILLFLQVSSWDYISVLYGNVLGVIFMSICLVVYGAAIMLAERIMNIQV